MFVHSRAYTHNTIMVDIVVSACAVQVHDGDGTDKRVDTAIAAAVDADRSPALADCTRESAARVPCALTASLN